MKRILKTICSAILCLALLLTVPIQTQAVTTGTYYEMSYEIVNGEVTITGCEWDTFSSVTIPETIEGCPVTRIQSGAFFNSLDLVKIILPNSLTCVGSIAFPNTTAFEYTIYDNGQYVGNDENPYLVLVDAVSEDITACTIHEDTKVIAGGAFAYCSNLTSITIPDGVCGIGDSAFLDCTALEQVTIGANVKSINMVAFRNCAIREIVLPDGLLSIGDEAFSECVNLTDISIPDSITSMGRMVFRETENLSYNTYDNATYLGNSSNPYAVLMGAVSEEITTCAIHPDTKAIVPFAFAYCRNLTSLTIPDGVKDIGYRTFHYCENLSSVQLGSSVKTIGEEAFAGCKSLTSITLPNSVTTVGQSAFEECRNLQSVTIGSGVKEFPMSALSKCNALTGIWVNTGNESYCSDEFGVLYTKDQKYLLRAPITLVDHYNVAADTVLIEEGAFSFCSNLVSIQIPNGVYSIGNQAFSGCYALDEVYYDGSMSQWRMIEIGAENGALSYAEFFFAIEEEQTPNPLDYLSYRIEVGQVTITDCNENVAGALVIPAELEDCPVTAIGSYAFENCAKLTSVEMPDSITTIGSSAFENCTKLTSVVMSDSITTIGYRAFCYCENLKSVNLSSNLTEISDYAFFYCGKLSDIQLPDSLTYLGSNAFMYDYALEKITIPAGVGQIREETFYDCSSLKEVTISSGVTTIGENAFDRCYRLTTVNIPHTITKIGEAAFANTGLQEIRLGIGVEEIGENAFVACNSLERILVMPNNKYYSNDEKGVLYNKDQTKLIAIPGAMQGTYEIPEGIRELNAAMFGTNQLNEIRIPASVTKIETRTFENCYYLTKIQVDDNNPNYSSDSRGVLFNKNKNLLIQAPVGMAGTYAIAGSVARIGDYAFYGCLDLTHITISAGVEEIGNEAFSFCGIEQITIPGSVREIEERAFAACYSLTDVQMEEGIRTIGDGAFAYCENLRNITIPASVVSIGANVFQECTALNYQQYDNAYYIGTANNPYSLLVKALDTSITQCRIHPDTVKIEAEAFKDCNLLQSVTLPDSLECIDQYAFYGCQSLQQIDLPDSVKEIGKYAFYDCQNLSQIYIPEGVSQIEEYTFHNCFNLPVVTIPDSVKSIGQSAFDGCTGLGLVEFGNGVTSIGQYAFASCTNLSSLDLPESLTEIGDGAFYGCSGLTELYIPGSVTTIGEYAFGSLYNLITLELGQGVTTICNSAFHYCEQLHQLTIPDSVTTIEDGAFYSCYALDHILYAGTQAQWAQINMGDNDPFINEDDDVIHFNASADSVYPYQNCQYTGLFCEVCMDFVYTANDEPGGHTYQDAGDRSCEMCGAIRTVQSISMAQQPNKTQFSLMVGVLDTTGGRILINYSDGTQAELPISPAMVSGFDNQVYGWQTLTVTYDDQTTTYTIRTVADTAPDELDILVSPDKVSYFTNEQISLSGMVLQATYGDMRLEIPAEDLTMSPVDMSQSGVKLVTVWFNGVGMNFAIYVHNRMEHLVDSSLYPESQHTYPNDANETRRMIYPGAESLVLTFAPESYTENNWDFVYVLDKNGNEIAALTGDLAGKQVTVPGDTVQIRLTSDGSVNYYGYAFSSIRAVGIEHEGVICTICNQLNITEGNKVILDGNTQVESLEIPAGVTLELDGCFLTVENLVCFGQITDNGGGGCLFTDNLELSGNEWLPVRDNEVGCYRFFDYEVKNLGVKHGEDSATFGFALDFSNPMAYSVLQNSADMEFAVDLSWGSGSQTFAFGQEMVNRYARLQHNFPDQQACLMLNVTGIDALADGTVISVKPEVAADNMDSKEFEPLTYTVGAPEEPEVPEAPEEEPGIVTVPRTGSAYKLVMQKNGTMLYFNGNTESASVTYRLATTTDVNKAVDVYLEEYSGGYQLYFMNGTTKTYIRVYQRSAGSGSLELTTNRPGEVYRFDTTAKTLVYDHNGTYSYYMGTYSSYTTFSVSNTSYITGSNASKVDVSQYPARLYKVG